jgi:hypothetical protein
MLCKDQLIITLELFSLAQQFLDISSLELFSLAQQFLDIFKTLQTVMHYRTHLLHEFMSRW